MLNPAQITYQAYLPRTASYKGVGLVADQPGCGHQRTHADYPRQRLGETDHQSTANRQRLGAAGYVSLSGLAEWADLALPPNAGVNGTVAADAFKFEVVR